MILLIKIKFEKKSEEGKKGGGFLEGRGIERGKSIKGRKIE